MNQLRPRAVAHETRRRKSRRPSFRLASVVRATGLVSLLLVGFGTGPACDNSRKIDIEVTVPKSVGGEAAWFEVGAYQGATCAAVSKMLGNGVPEGATSRLAFRSSAPRGPKFGDVPNGTYAFAGVARDDNCAVLAQGCEDVDVGDNPRVVIRLTPTESPTGKCAAGASCQAARCVPANDNSSPGVGADCSLELVGSGPLVAPFGGTGSGGGSLISAPVITATSQGFLIVYREIGSAGARLVLLPVDTAGGALPSNKPELRERCTSSGEKDGIGLVMNGDVGMIALARQPCSGKSALELLNFTARGESSPDGTTLGKFLVSSSPNDVPVRLSSARPAGGRAGGGGFVVFTEGGTARIANMDAAKGIIGPNGTFGGTTGIVDAWIATSDRVTALLAAAVAQGGGSTPDAGGPPTNTKDELRLLMTAAGTPANSFDVATNQPRSPVSFPGRWASIAALSGRVIVLSGGRDLPVQARAFDLGRDEPSDTQDLAVASDKEFTTGDLAIVGDRAYFAVLRRGTVELHAYANASTKPTPLRSVSFAREPRISAISYVRDGRVSVTATATRVAVAWTTAKELDSNDPVGGYAVFACRD
jgi:hypothetical protein